MSAALLTVRIGLALILGVAGLAKLADRAGTRAAIEGFGGPRLLSGPVSLLLPLCELAVSVALLPSASARQAAVAAAVLFTAFAAVIAAALARGRRPDCHCFGRMHSAPADSRTLARAGLLAAAAVFAAVEGPGPSAVAWVARLDSRTALAAGAIVCAVAFGLANATFSWRLLRQNGRLWRRLEELGPAASGAWEGRALAVGEPVPEVSVRRPDGARLNLESLLAQHRDTVLVFTDPGCAACGAVLEAAAREGRAGQPILVIGRGDPGANVSAAAAHGLEAIFLQSDREVTTAFGLPGVPGAIRVGADRRLASAPALGRDAALELVRSARLAAKERIVA